jgi:ergothioneine biosynthesis glutamate--cysteine ligase EgtA
MTTLRPTLGLSDVGDHVAEHVFGPGADPDGLGVELEWLTSQGGREHRLPVEAATALIDSVGPLPRGSHLTIEPGGQLELSSAPFRTIDAVCDAASTDLAVLDRACDERCVELLALGADPVRPPQRVTLAPRYLAMEQYFDQFGRAGRTMMCNTAAIQVNVGLGAPDDVAARWALANHLGPTLIATFANSPFTDGLPSGWQSSRLRAWWALDPSRSAPVPCDRAPVDQWSAYALDARVMLIRLDDGRCVPVIEPMSFGQWLSDGHELGWPDADDLAYHLTTLFPPVRPKGWLELRMFDALPDPAWKVAVAVAGSLLADPAVADEVEAAVGPTADLWVDAAQLGLGHPDLARSARAVFALARRGLAHAGVSTPLQDLVADYDERWVARGRSPADDRLDAWRIDGDLFPPDAAMAGADSGPGRP